MAVMLDAPWAGATFTPPTPLDLATIETALVTQLASQITNIECARFADKPEAYRLTHRIGAALVRFDGSTYGPLMDTAAVVQRRTLRFAVRLVVRDLGWSYGGDPSGPSPGAYALIESIRAALTGFQIAGCSKMYPVRERFMGRDNQGGLWLYESIFAFTTVAVEASQIDNFPLFTLGTALEEGGQTLVQAASSEYTFNASDQISLAVGNVSFVVVENAMNGAAYIANIDYTLDTVNGIIGRLSSGNIRAGATVTIRYSYADVISVTASGGQAPLAPSN
jgi:hypothetical protein